MKQVSFDELANFQPKQMEAMYAMASHKYILYGGAAGAGKSYWLRWMALRRILEFGMRGLKGVRVGIFCEDYPALKDRHLNRIMFEFPEYLGELNKTEHDYVLKPEYGGGVISFRNLNDPSRYLSSEFADEYVDEVTRNTRESFEFLITRLRWGDRSGGVTDNKFVAASNPGGVGHGWVKKLWVDRNFADEKFNPDEFCFVRAFYYDNKYLPASYGDQLSMMSDEKVRAYRDGDWSVFKGQFFTEWREGMIVDNWERQEDEMNDIRKARVICGLDYGYSKPSCVLWAREVNGVFYIFRELYGTHMTFEELAKAIILEGEPDIIYADPSIWSKKDSPNSGADKMIGEFGRKQIRLMPAINDRELGWGEVKGLMKSGNLKVFRNCRNLIRTIPNQVYVEDGKGVTGEDLDSDGEDHAADSLRYLCYTHKLTKKPPRFYSKEVAPKSDLEEVFAPRNQNNLTRPVYGISKTSGGLPKRQ